MIYDSPEFQTAFELLKARCDEDRRASLEDIAVWPPLDRPTHEWVEHGLRCLIVRGQIGLCGYVHVPVGHSAERKWYDDVDVDVHGGLTFRKRVADGSWFGFDTMHAHDWLSTPLREHPGRVWTEENVIAETERLAEQLSRM